MLTLKGDCKCPSPKSTCSKEDTTRLACPACPRRFKMRLMSVLRIPPEDFYQIIYALPRNRFLHTPSFLGMSYSDDLILLDITFISGRPKETRLALLKALNDGIVTAAGISPDDLLVTFYEVPGENISFGRGMAQRAHISDKAEVAA